MSSISSRLKTCCAALTKCCESYGLKTDVSCWSDVRSVAPVLIPGQITHAWPWRITCFQPRGMWDNSWPVRGGGVRMSGWGEGWGEQARRCPVPVREGGEARNPGAENGQLETREGESGNRVSSVQSLPNKRRVNILNAAHRLSVSDTSVEDPTNLSRTGADHLRRQEWQECRDFSEWDFRSSLVWGKAHPRFPH